MSDDSQNKLIFHVADYIVQHHHMDFGDPDSQIPYLDWEALDQYDHKHEWLKEKIDAFKQENDVEDESLMAYWLIRIRNFSDVGNLYKSYMNLVTTVSSQETIDEMMESAVNHIDPTTSRQPVDELVHYLNDDITAYYNEHEFRQFGPELPQEAFDAFHERISDMISYFGGPPTYVVAPDRTRLHEKEKARNTDIFHAVSEDVVTLFDMTKEQEDPRERAKLYFMMGLMGGLYFALKPSATFSHDNPDPITLLLRNWGEPRNHTASTQQAGAILAKHFNLPNHIGHEIESSVFEDEEFQINDECFDVFKQVDALFRPGSLILRNAPKPG